MYALGAIETPEDRLLSFKCLLWQPMEKLQLALDRASIGSTRIQRSAAHQPDRGQLADSEGVQMCL